MKFAVNEIDNALIDYAKPMIPNIRAIAIDLDGTLLDTIPDLAGAVNRVLAELKYPTLDLDLVKSFVGGGLGEHMRKSLRTVLKREPTDDEKSDAMARYRRHYAEHIADETTIYPGVIEGLEAFKSRGLSLSVVTNKWSSYTHALLEHFKLDRYFHHVVSGETLAHNKPHPAMIYWSAGKHGVHPGEMLMLGDSGNDSRSAQAAGSPVVLLDYGYSEGEALHDLRPNAIVSTFTDIPALLAT
jgi:phosphoglycolate phosphatase